MNRSQITFFVDDVNSSAVVASALSTLAKKFKSLITIINITQNRRASLSTTMGIFQAGLLKDDLCQIEAIGLDSELACFVLKGIIAEHYSLVGSNISSTFSDQLSERIPQLNLPCDVHWHYARACTQLSKFECLKGLAHLIHPQEPDELILAFIKREERSSTCVTPGIALPHVMFADIDHLAVAVIASKEPISWASVIGDVNLAIALVLPAKPNREQIVTVTNLTRNLLCDQMTERLVTTRNSIDLQALLMYSMTRLL